MAFQTVVEHAKAMERLYETERALADRLAEACEMLMRIIGPKEDPAWADDDQLDAAYDAEDASTTAWRAARK